MSTLYRKGRALTQPPPSFPSPLAGEGLLSFPSPLAGEGCPLFSLPPCGRGSPLFSLPPCGRGQGEGARGLRHTGAQVRRAMAGVPSGVLSDL